jgi:hypothetical protein
MSHGDGAGELGKQRQGTCHRCGWRGPVAKVSRRARKRLSIGNEYGRLCADCSGDLVKAQSALPRKSVPGHRKLRAGRYRDVA